ncbi:MAG: inositol monophosphatase [Proteobacteria bacterium]|nr:inositol monophosphatase [Pseudomonadota bacterium]
MKLTFEELRSRFLAAQAVAAEAGRLAQGFLAEPQRLEIVLKGPQDLVTAADLAIERLIADRLARLFPDDAFLAEESYVEAHSKDATALWVIDPIDGTGNFAGGRPDWCVSIGFMSLGEPAIGVIDVPAAGEQYAAWRGQGATRNGKPVRVSGRTSLAESTLGVDFSFRSPPEPYLGIVEALLRKRAEYRRNGSSALSLAHVASGRLDGFVELHLYPWDVMAGIVLVREAGGWVSDFLGQGGLDGGGPVIASAPGIRDELVAVLETFVGRT